MRTFYSFATFNRRPYLLFVAVLGFSLLQGCYKRELQIEPGENVHVVFDWSGFTDAELLPSSMRIWFYNPDGAPVSYIAPASGYTGTLPEGNYKVLAYNPGATGVDFRNLNEFDLAEIYSLPKAGEDGIIECPQFVYGGSLGLFDVRTAQRNEVILIPHIYIRSILLRVKVSGEELSPQLSVSIGGVATALNISTGKPVSGGNGTIIGTLVSAGSVYEGHLTLLGNDSRHPNILTLLIVFPDGSQRTIQENITEAMDKLGTMPENDSLTIELNVEAASVNGELTATLTGWKYETPEIDI